MTISLVTLQLFVAVAESKNMTRAARKAHIAASAVSKRISDLEDSLGIQLLYRESKGVELTPAGEAILRHARNALRYTELIKAEAKEYSGGVRGHIQLAANPSAVNQFLPDDLPGFIFANPNTKIDVREEMSGAILEMVRDDLIHFGIYWGFLEANGLEVLEYRRDRLALVVPEDHALADRAELSFEETLDYDHVALQAGSSLQYLFRQKAFELGRNIRFRITVLSFEGIRKMVASGLGVAILPDGVILPYLDTMPIRAVPLSDSWAHRQLNIAVKDIGAIPTVARKLIDHLRGQQGKAPRMGLDGPDAEPTKAGASVCETELERNSN